MTPPGPWPNLAEMFFERAERFRDRPFLWAKRGGRYHPQTWGEVEGAVRALARGLRALGLARGDRVVLLSENRPEWAIADIAAMTAGGITVPAYTTATEDDLLHVLTDSGARIALVSTRRLARTLLPAALRAPALETVIALEPLGLGQREEVEVVTWDEALARGAAETEPEDDVRGWARALKREDTACILYTSGTGGRPKGVMLSHANILHNCRGAYDLFADLRVGREVFLSFLPLSHSYEHTAGQFFPISVGAEIFYAEGIEHLGRNLVEVRPTHMTAVPRLYETFRERILHEARRRGGLSRRLFDRALELGRRRYEAPESLGPGERILDRVLDVLVRRRVQGRFGGRLRAMVSGGAPLNFDVGLFFTALGFTVLQGYGQTEAAPVVSCNRARRIKLHTVGPPLAGVEVRIAADGEILVRGELVMQGYWNAPEETARTLEGGWLHTGDIGRIDDEGYIEITDRKKDFIKNSGGDLIAPQRIEGLLVLQPEVGQAMVYGDRRPHLVALLVPDPTFAEGWAAENGRGADLGALAGDEAFRRAVGQAVERVNARLPAVERVRRFALAPEPFSVANGMMTPTLKIRRHRIREAYGAVLDGLYEGR